MSTLRNKTSFPLSHTTTWREKPGRGPLVDKVMNMKFRYGMQRDVVPTKVGQASGGPTRRTNANGMPTR
ncbi:MAG TPA: hypothetical protein VJQ82_25900 [Terriglobales bacterium]|nr:hypothetical protein [Terriglobales bacterium]